MCYDLHHVHCRSARSAAIASIPPMQSLSVLPLIPAASNAIKATSVKVPNVSALPTRCSVMASASQLAPFVDPWVSLHAVSRLGWMPSASTTRRFVVYSRVDMNALILVQTRRAVSMLPSTLLNPDILLLARRWLRSPNLCKANSRKRLHEHHRCPGRLLH